MEIKKKQGFTLIELMVAIAISVILLNGVIEIFVSSKQSYRTADGLGRMQENARYALETLAFDIRQAGYIPCRKTNNTFNLLNDKEKGNDAFGAPLFGFEAGSVFDFPDFPAVGTTPDDRLAGSDGIRILRGGDDLVTVEDVPANVAAALHLSNLHDIVPGEIVLICDDEKSAIFQVTNSNENNVTIVHNQGNSDPGNCANDLTDACGASPENDGDVGPFGPGAQVVNFKSLLYYIGPSLSNDTAGRNIPNTNSLYRKEQRVIGGDFIFGDPQELVEGIESMQILYGEAIDPVTEAVRYVDANSVTSFDNVVSVRIGLLFHTPENISPTDDNRTYNVIGTSLTSPANFPTDRRQRYVFTETIQVRNRGVNVAPPPSGAGGAGGAGGVAVVEEVVL